MVANKLAVTDRMLITRTIRWILSEEQTLNPVEQVLAQGMQERSKLAHMDTMPETRERDTTDDFDGQY